MKISRTDPHFSTCRVLRPVRRFWFDPRRYLYPSEEQIPMVLDADEETGMVARQVCNAAGQPLYINAAGDTVAVTDAVTVLLLNPETRRAFTGVFQPKVEVTYVRGLRIELRSVAPLGFQPRAAQPAAPRQDDGVTVTLPPGSLY